MPRIDRVGEFTNGINVRIVKERHGVCGAGADATVSSCYTGDDGSGEWVYVRFPNAVMCGPFAFRPDDLEVAA